MAAWLMPGRVRRWQWQHACRLVAAAAGEQEQLAVVGLGGSWVWEAAVPGRCIMVTCASHALARNAARVVHATWLACMLYRIACHPGPTRFGGALRAVRWVKG